MSIIIIHISLSVLDKIAYVNYFMQNCTVFLDEEIEDINEFKLLMKNKSFNIQINQNFAEFVHKVFFKYWVLYASFYFFVY